MILEVKDLNVEVSGRLVLKDVSLSIGFGETVFLLGPNGSGKTSFIQSILGNPIYKVLKGSIISQGFEITTLKPEERAKIGLAASFQIPPKIKGLKAGRLLEEVSKRFNVHRSYVESLVSILKLEEFMNRELYVGFSGGEAKRFEILLALLQKPKLLLLDEPDSGVDIENLAVIGKTLDEFLHEDDDLLSTKRSILIVTHTGALANYINPSRAYIMLNGEIVCYGKGEDVIKRVFRDGFEKCKSCYEKFRGG